MHTTNAVGAWRVGGYFAGLSLGCAAIFGNLAGGMWTLVPLALVLLVELADWLTHDDTRAPSPSPAPERLADLVLLAHVVTHTAAVGTLLYGVHAGILEKTFVWYAALATGVNSGTSGIVCAHELIHRGSRRLRALGVWNLLLVNYAHFRIEHMVHHRLVGTRQDPATGRRGESVYWFILRTIPQQFWQALSTEADRARRRGKLPFGPANFVVWSAALQLAICGALFALFGARMLQVYLLQSLVAIVLLEIVNYIEHYGLVRAAGEPLGVQHSWGTDKVASRYSLLELTRHADHHLHASRPYIELESHDASPHLPSGYWGMAYLALVPPLWFWVVDRRIPEQVDEMPIRRAA